MTTTTASIVSIPSAPIYFLTPDGVLVSASVSSTGAGAVWQNGVLSYGETYPAGDGYGSVYGVNDSGMVVGTTSTSSKSYNVLHGTVWQSGTAVSLGSLGSGQASALAINDAGMVVGYSSTTVSDPIRAFVWQNGVMTYLPSLAAAAGGYDHSGLANAINNSGQIVGQSAFDEANGLAHNYATLWQNGQPIDLGTPTGFGDSYAQSINSSGDAVGRAYTVNLTTSDAVLFHNGSATVLPGLAANQSSNAQYINDSGLIVGWAVAANGTQDAVMWKNGVITDLNTLLPANSGWVLSQADGVEANGEIYGEGSLNGVFQKFLLNPAGASSSTGVDASTPNLTVNGSVSVPTTVDFSGTASNYSISVSGGTVIVTDTGTGRTSTDHLTNVTALHFSDVTDIVAATPGPASAVTGGNITELYGAAFGRLPDVGGLVFYQNFLTANPSTPLLQFAEWFLSSTEYKAAHSYAQSSAGDTQFIQDSYQNLLGRTPLDSEVSFYETKVLAPAVANLVPGTTAYSDAQLQAHALMLVYFSASTEFLGDVQVTAQNPSSAHHWLILT